MIPTGHFDVRNCGDSGLFRGLLHAFGSTVMPKMMPRRPWDPAPFVDLCGETLNGIPDWTS
jgi:hypothetical protein